MRGAANLARYAAMSERLGLGRMLRLRPAETGNFGRCMMMTCTEGEFVVKGPELWRGQLREERWMTALIHARTGLPVPWPYVIDDADGAAYAVMPRLSGRHGGSWLGDRSGCSLRDRLVLAEAMGLAAAEVNSCTWPHTGRYDPAADSIVEPAAGSPTLLLEVLAERVRKLDISDAWRLGTADLRLVDQIMSAVAAEVPPAGPHALVWSDFHLNNVNVTLARQRPVVSGMFDLGGHFGEGLAILARQLGMYIEADPDCSRAFLRAYGIVDPARLRPHMLLDRLEIWEWAWPSDRVWWDRQLPFAEWWALFDRGMVAATRA